MHRFIAHISQTFRGMRFRVPHANDALRHAFHGIHLTYFGGVFLEGHGVYALAGGGLFVLLIANYFLHFE